jgi:hypothetical protein
MIRKLKDGQYRLYARKKDPKTGKRRNLGTCGTRAAARRRAEAYKRNARRKVTHRLLEENACAFSVSKPHQNSFAWRVACCLQKRLRIFTDNDAPLLLLEHRHVLLSRECVHLLSAHRSASPFDDALFHTNESTRIPGPTSWLVPHRRAQRCEM